jgi:copper(I)-binding protein
VTSGGGLPALALAAGAVLVGLAGCGGDGPAVDDGGVLLADAWIRPTPPVTNVGAFYLVVRNGTARPDRVVGASSPRCAEMEIHRTETVDGVSSMGPADRGDLDLEAGSELVFEPSGLHVMCLGLDRPVVEGDRIPLTIELEGAGSRAIEAVAENR